MKIYVNIFSSIYIFKWSQDLASNRLLALGLPLNGGSLLLMLRCELMNGWFIASGPVIYYSLS